MRDHPGQYCVETWSQRQGRNRQCAQKQAGLLENTQHAQVPGADGTAARTATSCLKNTKT